MLMEFAHVLPKPIRLMVSVFLNLAAPMDRLGMDSNVFQSNALLAHFGMFPDASTIPTKTALQAPISMGSNALLTPQSAPSVLLGSVTHAKAQAHVLTAPSNQELSASPSPNNALKD